MTAARHSAAPLHPDTARAANEQIRRLRAALETARENLLEAGDHDGAAQAELALRGES